MSSATTGLKFASAISGAADTQAALEQVAQQLSGQWSGEADLVVVFISSHHAAHFEKIQAFLTRLLSPRAMIGATAEGVLGIRREIERSPGLCVLAASMPGVTLQPFNYAQIDWPRVLDSPLALAESLRLPEKLQAVVLLADPFSTPITTLLPAFEACYAGIPIVGGMASGAREAGGNRLMLNGEVVRAGAVGIALAGDVDVHCTVSQGCRPIGKPYVITGSKRHVVHELGGRNALKVIQEMAACLSEEDRLLVQTQGLQVGRVINEYKPHFGRGDFLIRGVVGFEQETGYFAIGDPQTRVGQTIQFHVRDQRTAEEDLRLLLDAQKLHGQAAGALLFTCNGRGTRLYDRPHADAAMLADAIGDVPVAGCFAAGEIGPIGCQNFLHGHTASLMVFRERERS